jgi:single-strand DNA-binding protein
MLNKVMIHGRFTTEPELRKTNSGKSVASFTIACDRNKESTDFIPCVAWEKTADLLAGYFGKGQEAIVSGRMTSRSYTDKECKHRTAYEVMVETVDFCGKKGDRMETPERPQVFTEEQDDGELPF